jgi:hypothetical protein
MSKPTLVLSLAAFTAFAATSFAVTPSGAPDGAINHLGVAKDYSQLSLSFYAGIAEKTYDGKPDMDFTRFNAVVGYNLNRWLSVYGLVGTMEQKVKIGGFSATDDSAIFGAGVWAGLIDVDQLSFFDGVDRYTLSAGAEISYADFDSGTWTSLDAFLMFEVQGDVNRQSFIFPRTLGLYFGPVFSLSLSSDYDTASSNSVGFGGGVNILFTDDVSLKIGGDVFSDDSTVYGQFSINF